MKNKYLQILLIVSLLALSLNKLYSSSNDTIKLVNVPVAGVYTQPNMQSNYDSQKVYGHFVTIIKTISEAWVKAKIDDDITNYMQNTDLIDDNLEWRTSETLHRIKCLIGCVYPEQSVKHVPLIKLPYNAYINLIDLSDDGLWALIKLINGATGWIMSGDIEPIENLSYNTIIERSKQFIGLPYIWGGTSSFGFDCSGLTSTLAQQMGHPMKRDASAQAADENLIDVSYDDIQPGDFIYFGKDQITHVALCIEQKKIIHATVIYNTPRVVITSFDLPHLYFNCARRLPDCW